MDHCVQGTAETMETGYGYSVAIQASHRTPHLILYPKSLPTSDLSQPPSQPVFKLSCLPVELRSKIWRYALMEEARNRLVFIEQSSLRLVFPFHLVSPFLTVNRESRQEAKAFYELKLEILEMPQKVEIPDDHLHLPFRFQYAVMHNIMKEFNYNYKVLGAIYVSPTQDVFVQKPQSFLRGEFWNFSYEQLICTPPLSEQVRDKIRRLSYCHIQWPGLSIDKPDDCCGMVEGHIRMAEEALKCANQGWQAQHLRGVREHGVLWINQTVPQYLIAGCFASTVIRVRGKGSFIFQKVIRRLEDPKRPHWVREIEDPFVGIRPWREQRFDLGLEDLAGLAGES